MQAKQELSHRDWHQLLLAELLEAPLVETRLGPSFTSVGHLLKFDVTDNFPATKAKKLFFEQVKRELYCFLKGMTSKKDLNANGVHIWDDNMRVRGLNDIGPIYGWQWRHWGASRIDEIRMATHQGFDQLRFAIDDLVKTNGSSRRAIVSAWNPPQVLGPSAALPPCHVLFQFNVVAGTLYTDVYQRSADAFLGLPFDVASFAILSRLVRNELAAVHWTPQWGLPITREVLNYHVANMHLYCVHGEAALEELRNAPSKGEPWLMCNGTVDAFDHKACELLDYYETRVIKAKLLT